MTLEEEIRGAVDTRLDTDGHMYAKLGFLFNRGEDVDEVVEIWKRVCEEFYDDPRWVFHKPWPAPHAVGEPERVRVAFQT